VICSCEVRHTTAAGVDADGGDETGEEADGTDDADGPGEADVDTGGWDGCPDPAGEETPQPPKDSRATRTAPHWSGLRVVIIVHPFLLIAYL
jgi:hypothetical protein